MHPVLSSDIMLMTRIREIVHLDIALHAFADEAQAMLPKYDRVDGPLAYQQLAFQVLGLVD